MSKNVNERSMIVAFLDPTEVTKTRHGEITNMEWIRLKQEEFKAFGIETTVMFRGTFGGKQKKTVALRYTHENDIPELREYHTYNTVKKSEVDNSDNNYLYRCLREITELDNGYVSPINKDGLFEIIGKK